MTSKSVSISETHSDLNNMNDVWNIFNDFDDSKKKINIDDDNKCINKCCNSNNLMLIEYNYTCLDCNTIQDKFIDPLAEWRYYGSDDSKRSDPTRCGMPVNDLLPELSLGSVISTEFNKNSSYEMYTITKYQKWNSTSYKERTLCEIIDNITLNASNSGISQSIINDAKIFYKQIADKKISRGVNRNGLIASSVYMSCKANKVPRSAKEIAKVFNINVTTMTKGCKKFHDIMKTNMSCSNPEDFIMRFCCNLNIEEKYINLCIIIINKADEYSIVSENAPPSIAAGTIFLVSNLCNLKINKKDISKLCDISEVTINKCYKKLDKYKKHLLDKETLQEYNIKL